MKLTIGVFLLLGLATGLAAMLGQHEGGALPPELLFMLIIDAAALVLFGRWILLKKRKDRPRAMDDGQAFEHYIARLMRARGYTQVETTKKSYDFGVDVVAVWDGIRCGIQCKHYAQPVGPKAVQEVYAGIRHHQCHVGIVATNNTFTQSAHALAKSTGVLLWDRETLLLMERETGLRMEFP